MKMEKPYPINYIQNRKHWCWAVACKMTGEQYKKQHREYGFDLINESSPQCGQVTAYEFRYGVATDNPDGINPDLQTGREIRVDAWQRAIVMNANTARYTGYEGDVSGDDEAKSRGIKYYLTGDIHSSRITVESIGHFQNDRSLMDDYGKEMMKSFQHNEYVIGNAVLKGKNEYHSFVILCIAADRVMLYDPVNGEILYYGIEDVFKKGFRCRMGTGVIRWIQRIV